MRVKIFDGSDEICEIVVLKSDEAPQVGDIVAIPWAGMKEGLEGQAYRVDFRYWRVKGNCCELAALRVEAV
jgi:hypothetical protein